MTTRELTMNMEYAGLYPLPAICYCTGTTPQGQVFANEERTEFQIWAISPVGLGWILVARFDKGVHKWPPA